VTTQNSKLKTQNCSTDYHCHILPGIDDGAVTSEESVEMAKALVAAGFTTVCCTPHLIKGTYECRPAAIRERTEQLQLQLDAASISLKLLSGTEYYLDEYLPELLNDPLPLGDTNLLLIEIPNHAPLEFVKETCYRIKGSGFIPLIAHPERCSLLELMSSEPDRKGFLSSLFNSKLKTQNSKLNPHSTLNTQHSTLLSYLLEIGCKFQGNLGSFTGYYGERIRRKAEEFLAAGIYTHFGSDLHSVEQCEVLSAGQPMPLIFPKA
jgi:protein-tyrosine phosphatase